MSFDEKMLEGVLREIYYEEVVPSEGGISEQLYEATRDIFERATAQGMAQSRNKRIVEEEDFLRKYTHSIEVFSAFRAHRYGEMMASKLHDDEGNLLSFEEWRKATASIQSHFNRSWLETEYNTAILRAQQAADWKAFERDSDVAPNLTWMPTSSADPREEHAVFWRDALTLPVSDPFWDEHRPGDLWNCKCWLKQTDAPATPSKEIPKGKGVPKPAKGLETNPGKTAEMFSSKQPHYPNPKNCIWLRLAGGKTKNLQGRFLDAAKCPNNCNTCLYVIKFKPEAGSIKLPMTESYTKLMGNEHILVGPYQGAEFNINLNMAVALQKKFSSDVYMLPCLDPVNATQRPLRKVYLPSEVPTNKNVDFWVKGNLIEGKRMLDIEEPRNEEKVVKAIKGRISEAKSQARQVILEVPPILSRRVIFRAVKGYLKQSKSVDAVYVLKSGKLLVYKKAWL